MMAVEKAKIELSSEQSAVARKAELVPERHLSLEEEVDRSQFERIIMPLVVKSGTAIDEKGVWEKFGVAPASIPDWLALVGDSADGFPGLSGWGKRSASLVLAHYGTIDAIPGTVSDWEPELRKQVRNAAGLAARLASERELALLFRRLATLRVERQLLVGVDELAWPGPTPAFEALCQFLRDQRLADWAFSHRR